MQTRARTPVSQRLDRAARAVARTLVKAVLAVFGALLIAVCAVGVAVFRRRPERPRLLWGVQPIISLVNLSRAMAEAGYSSETVALYPSRLYAPELFDNRPYRTTGNVVLQFAGNQWRAYMFFVRALRRYDVFHYFFDGGILSPTPLGRIELPLLRALGKKIVLMPYGSDAFVFDTITNPLWRAGLMIEYGVLGDRAELIQRRLRRNTRRAHVVVGSVVHVASLPRWDVLPLTAYPIDTRPIEPIPPSVQGTVRIVHSANHRGAKGTDFLVAAVERLRVEGHDVELDLIERVSNEEALARVAAADVYVDQLLFGYAMAALEAMAFGKVVVSGIEDTPDYQVFRRYSYLDECPIVPASPETIADVLRDLIARRSEWPAIGRESRDYVEHRHSYAAAAELYGAIYRKLWDGEEVDLINLFHPLH